ncbi:MAG: ABZJ_00895 family protein [Candidatus Thiodiazotropha lotti]|nr:ABZJ_00895 family protein [Candidatus Thiodiazotropha lotti]MCG7984671.1 ABZJ_00895 family protein [Candidatus Thiodiazotropha lotti]MCG8005427.1 ABZJ_00895 family protein [Candidatus Thiodiazotropha lotti]MCG8008548.1 ABZJ_00895 family protein [Candidatus Thiodiazotropha lotti]MCW4189054.1 ABZJ_00895 family protein [Candidatus Thiodiazotropha lotti]
MEENVTISKYVIWFTVVNLSLTICISIALILLEIDSSTSATIAALVGAAMVAGSKFIQDHKRVPNRSEKTKLVWLSYLTTWLVSLLLLGGFVLATNEGSQLLEVMISVSMGNIVGVFVFFSIVILGTLSLSYGFLARKQLEGMKRKGAI